MDNSIKFTCTKLEGTGKKGILKPDADGYYELILGALNVYNSAGMYYVYEGAKELFESSSQLMRRVKRGALRSENGHPTRLPNESFDDFVNRYIEINPKNVCAHISELWLNFKDVKGNDGKPIIAIMGKVCPSGPLGPMLEKSLNNTKENVCFSIRSFTADWIENGIIKRELKNVITFDYVNEPGIYIAEKYNSPALESLSETRISKNQMVRALSKESSSMAMESAGMNASELFTSLGWSLPDNEKPIFTSWK